MHSGICGAFLALTGWVAGRQWALPRYQEPLARIGGTGGQGSSCLPLLSTIRGFRKAAL